MNHNDNNKAKILEALQLKKFMKAEIQVTNEYSKIH